MPRATGSSYSKTQLPDGFQWMGYKGKIFVVMVNEGVRVVVSTDWLVLARLGCNWSLHLVLISALELFCPTSPGFVLWDHSSFFGLELKHNWGQDCVFSLIENSVSVVNRPRTLFLRLLDNGQNLIVLRD